MAHPASRASCFWRMALLLSSVSDSEWPFDLRGLILGPTMTLGPPNQADHLVGDGTSASAPALSTSPKAFFSSDGDLDKAIVRKELERKVGILDQR